MRSFGLHHGALALALMLLLSPLMGVEATASAGLISAGYFGWEFHDVWRDPKRFEPGPLRKHFFDFFTPTVTAFLLSLPL